MKKRFTSVFIFVLALIMTTCVFACSETPPPSITLSQTEIAISVYDTQTLTATGMDSIEFSSSDNTVVSVDANGKLIGVGVGSATVTATSGDVSATCQVTVTAATSTPSLTLSSSSVDLMTGNSYNLTAAVSYKGEEQTDATVSYSVADDGVATVAQNGQITAVAIGTTTVTVTASWRGADAALLTEEVPVTVRGNVVIEFSSQEISLATADMSADGGKANEATISATATVDGVPTAVTFELDPDGDEVVELNGNTVTATAAGATRVRAKAISGGEPYYSEWRNVVVEYAVFDRKDTTLEFLLTDATLTFDESLLGSGVTVTAIKDGEIAVAEGNILDKSKMTAGIRTYRVETANAAYEYTAEVITLKIMDKEDLDGMLTAMQVAGTTNKFDGYVVLGANINYEGEAYNYYSDTSRTLVRGEGFTGTFDGKGYTIYDIKFTDLAGMFGYPANGAVIKNVAFESVTFAASGGANWGAMIFGQHCYATLIENVFVSVKSVTGNARVIADECGNANWNIPVLRNVVIDAAAVPAAQKIINGYTTAPTCENVAVITANDNIGANNGAVKYANMGELMSSISSMDLGSIWATEGARVGFDLYAPVVKSTILDNIATEDINIQNGQVVTLVENGAQYVSGSVSGGNGKVTFANGKLTVADDMAEDAICTLTIYNALNPADFVTVNVNAKSFIINDYTNEVTLELLLTESTLEVDIQELFDDGNEVIKVTDLDNDVVVSTSSTLDKSKMAYGVHTYQIETESCAYKVKAEVITLKIMTKADLDSMLTKTAVSGTTNEFDGYITLGANINYGGAAYDYGNGDSTRTYVYNAGGFKGVFDGKGYTVYDLKLVNMAGLFGNLQVGAVIKNVAFENLVMQHASGNIYGGSGNNYYPTVLGYTCNADSIDNVYINIKSATANSAISTLTRNRYSASTPINISNVIVDGSGLPDTGILFSNHGNSNLSFNNVAVIAAADGNVIGLRYQVTGTVNRVADMSALKTAAAGMSLGSIWDIDGSRVTFASMTKEVKEVILPSAQASVSGANDDILTVLTNGTSLVTGAVEGGDGKITYADGKVTIASDLAASTTATLTLTSIFDSADVKTVSITVTVIETVSINTQIDYETYGSNTAPLTITIDNLDGTVTGATLSKGSSLGTVTAVAGANANEVTLSGLASNALGDYTLTVDTTSKKYTMPLSIVSKVLKTADDFKNLLVYANTGTNLYGGYLVLGNDINYESATYDWTNVKNTTTITSDWNAKADNSSGWTGTFDGRGHTVYDINVQQYVGIFTGISASGVIKNVGFANVGLVGTATSSTSGSLLGGQNFGTVENVFIEITSVNSNNYHAAISDYFYAGAQLKNTVVYFMNSAVTKSTGNGTLFQSNLQGTATNVFVVTDRANINNTVTYDTGYTGISKISGTSDLSPEAQTALGSMWTFEYGVPMFASAVNFVGAISTTNA